MEGDPGPAVDGYHLLHRAVRQDRPDAGIQLREDALGLSQGIGEENAGRALLLVLPPPGVDVGCHVVRVGPVENRKPEGGLGDESVAAQRLEGRAGRVRMALEIAGDDPHLAPVLHPDLGRAEDVSGRMQRQPDAVEDERGPVWQFLDMDGLAQPDSQQAGAFRGREIAPAPRPGVVGVRVGDDRPVDRLPGVDKKTAIPAVQPGFGILNHGLVFLEPGYGPQRLLVFLPL